MQAVVPEVFGDDLRQPVMLCIRPEVRIEPVELVRRTSPDRIADDGLVRIENVDLPQELFRLAKCMACGRMTQPRMGLVTAAMNSIIENATPEEPV